MADNILSIPTFLLLFANSTCTVFTRVSDFTSGRGLPSQLTHILERDVFHTGNPDTTLWEFRHGTGSFKRGNLVGLREIKRRASRHALVHREGSVATKQGSSQANLSTDPLPLPPESAEARLASLEHNLYDLSSRLQRSEESAHYMHTRSQTVFEAMNRLLHLNQELSRAMLSVVPSDSPAYRDGLSHEAPLTLPLSLFH